MRPSSRIRHALALACLGVSALPAAASALQEGPEVVEYAFREPPVNSAGIGSLADLRGKPVLIDFWGTR